MYRTRAQVREGFGAFVQQYELLYGYEACRIIIDYETWTLEVYFKDEDGGEVLIRRIYDPDTGRYHVEEGIMMSP